MLLSIVNIKHQPGASRHFQLSEALTAAESPEFIVTGPVGFSGSVTNESDGLFRLEGAYEAEIAYSCARCLQAGSRRVAGEIRALFSETAPVASADETDCYPLTGDEISMDELIKNDISLNLPMRLLCGEDCRGLCPSCGADLNKTTCDCGEKHIDPRWEKLKDFKFNSEQ